MDEEIRTDLTEQPATGPAAEPAAEVTAIVGAPEPPDEIGAPVAPEEPVEEPAPKDPRYTVVDIQFKEGGKSYFFYPGDLPLKAGDHVIVDTAKGMEYAVCVSAPHDVPAREVVSPLRQIVRLATARDEKIHADNQKTEQEAYQVCLRKIEELGLEMQLVSAECAFDGSKLLFFFTADNRVDFRELVKSLASVFHTRIELRQIGVRDKAKMVGGLGICGRPFCCAQFLDDFQPVSIKMAKTQNLSLNPTKISGTCGRLMCCLKYEQEAYEDLLKTCPKNDSYVETEDGRGTVTDVNLLRQTVRVRLDDEPDSLKTYSNCDICVLRNGKAKKGDPPIPPRDPSAPAFRPKRKAQEPAAEEETLVSPVIRGELPEEAPAAAEHKSHRSRGGRRHRSSRSKKPEGEKQAAQQPEKQSSSGTPRAEKPSDPAAQGEKKRSGRRRRNYRRKPRQEGGGSSGQASE